MVLKNEQEWYEKETLCDNIAYKYRSKIFKQIISNQEKCGEYVNEIYIT